MNLGSAEEREELRVVCGMVMQLKQGGEQESSGRAGSVALQPKEEEKQEIGQGGQGNALKLYFKLCK